MKCLNFNLKKLAEYKIINDLCKPKSCLRLLIGASK